jgi:hypothetical protein
MRASPKPLVPMQRNSRRKPTGELPQDYSTGPSAACWRLQMVGADRLRAHIPPFAELDRHCEYVEKEQGCDRPCRMTFLRQGGGKKDTAHCDGRREVEGLDGFEVAKHLVPLRVELEFRALTTRLRSGTASIRSRRRT